MGFACLLLAGTITVPAKAAEAAVTAPGITPWTGDATFGPFRLVIDNQAASTGGDDELQ